MSTPAHRRGLKRKGDDLPDDRPCKVRRTLDVSAPVEGGSNLSLFQVAFLALSLSLFCSPFFSTNVCRLIFMSSVLILSVNCLLFVIAFYFSRFPLLISRILFSLVIDTV
jgi:hypothetical protein